MSPRPDGSLPSGHWCDSVTAGGQLAALRATLHACPPGVVSRVEVASRGGLESRGGESRHT
eukprot:3923865-Prymnesium_polylepis.1